MRPKSIAMALALSTGLLNTGAAAQHEQHHPEQGSAPADNNKMMLGRMPQMTSIQQEVSTLANQLLKSFAAIENEKDPVVLQKKLAEHGVLLKELDAKVQGQSQMTERMRGQMMMMGQMMGGEQKKQ